MKWHINTCISDGNGVFNGVCFSEHADDSNYFLPSPILCGRKVAADSLGTGLKLHLDTDLQENADAWHPGRGKEWTLYFTFF